MPQGLQEEEEPKEGKVDQGLQEVSWQGVGCGPQLWIWKEEVEHIQPQIPFSNCANLNIFSKHQFPSAWDFWRHAIFHSKHTPHFQTLQECSGQVWPWALAELHQCYAGHWSHPHSQLSERFSHKKQISCSVNSILKTPFIYSEWRRSRTRGKHITSSRGWNWPRRYKRLRTLKRYWPL